MHNRILNKNSAPPSPPPFTLSNKFLPARSSRIEQAGLPMPGQRKSFSVPVLLSLMATLLLPAPALATPMGGTVTAGGATISHPDNSTTVIHQQTERSVIDWRSYNVGQREQVIYQQPDSSAISLNRVLGNDPSYIYGSIMANGQVFLINPHGVVFGPSAKVDVHGLMATTLDISNSDFMAGNHTFTASTGKNAGRIINQGKLTADKGGYVVLAGEKVDNNGVVEAQLGEVALASGSKITMDLAGDKLISLGVDEGTLKAAAGVTNRGALLADGGRVLMTAKTAEGLAATVVNNQGLIRARTIEGRSGDIQLLGDMDHGKVVVGGTLDASAPTGGNGGRIETSAATVTLDNPTVRASARHGRGGQWLMDPTDITIDAASAATISSTLSNGTGVMVQTQAAGADEGNITVSSAITKTGGGDATFTLAAQNDININADITASTGGVLDLVLNPDSDNLGGGVTNLGAVTLDSNGGSIWALGSVRHSSGAATINSTMQMGGLTLSDGTLTLNGTTSTGSYNQTNGVLQGNGALEVTDSFSLTGGSIDSAFTVLTISQSQGDLTLGGPITIAGDMVLDMNNGQGTVTQSAPISAGALGLLGTGAHFTLTDPNNRIGTLAGDVGSVALVNQPTLTIGTVDTTDSSVVTEWYALEGLKASGGINLTATGSGEQGRGIVVNKPLSSGGNITLTADAGDITVSSAITKTGSGDATLRFTAQNDINIAADITASGGGAFDLVLNPDSDNLGAGITNLGAATLDSNGGSIWALGNVRHSSGAATINSTLRTGGVTLSDGTLALNGYTSTGSYTQTNGVLQGNGALEVTDSFSLTGGSIDSAFTTLAISQAQGDLTLGGPITIAGDMVLDMNNGQGTVTQSAPISAGALGLLGTGAHFTLTDPNNRINTLAGDVGSVDLINQPTLTIGTVDTTAEPFSESYALEGLKAAGDINLTATGSSEQGGITVNKPIASTGGSIGLTSEHDITLHAAVIRALRNITLTANANGGSGDFIQNGGLITNAETTDPGDIVINANNITTTPEAMIASGPGGVIDLHATGNFTNTAGSNLFAPGPGGRWLVWSTDPSHDTRGGIVYDFKQYNALYGSTTVQGSGNGFLYSVAPVLTAGLSGTVSKTYDGTDTAALTAENYSVIGAIDGDTVHLNNPTMGSYDSANVGTEKAVTVTGLDFTASNNTAPVYGYALASDSITGPIGTITPVTPAVEQGATQQAVQEVAAITSDIIALTSKQNSALVAIQSGGAPMSEGGSTSEQSAEKQVGLDQSNTNNPLREHPLYSLDNGAVAGQNMVCK